jgi:hypothetical protein
MSPSAHHPDQSIVPQSQQYRIGLFGTHPGGRAQFCNGHLHFLAFFQFPVQVRSDLEFGPSQLAKMFIYQPIQKTHIIRSHYTYQNALARDMAGCPARAK